MPAFFKAIANINAAIRRNQVSVRVPRSWLVKRVLAILAMEGFIRSYTLLSDTAANDIMVYLAYFEGVQPVLKQIIPISKPGRKVYTSLKALFLLRKRNATNSKVSYLKYSKFTRIIISTSKGVMTEDQALALRLGGELICKFAV